jgi:hypothetical protein
MTKKEQAAVKALRRAIDNAAINDFPPPPGSYAHVQRTWKWMVTIACKAKARADATFGPEGGNE